MLFKQKGLIGIDIGSATIKVAELDVNRNGATLNSFGMIPTPLNSVGTGDLIDPGSIQMALKSVLAEIASKRKSASTGMWGTAVIVKKITIPKMDEKVIPAQLKFEAEQYIPFDINSVTLAYHLPHHKSNADVMDILLVAAQNEMVNQYSSVLQGAGLKPSIIDVSGFALANVFEKNYGKFNGETIGVFNFGATTTNFVVIQDGEVVFCRDIPVGGSNYTHEISKALGISLPEAESLKIAAIQKREVPEEVHQIIQATNDQINEEIRNSLEFLSASTNGVIPSRCYFTGGSSGTTGLIESIGSSTGIPFEEMNPFLKIKIGKKIPPQLAQKISSFASVVIGLGLRQIGDK